VIREEDITGIHEAADLFPEMGEEEIAELADDIRRNGLLVPILVTQDRKLLDGRNRMTATTIADVEPKFVEYTGDDPVGAVISMNIRRRHLNNKQKRELIEKLLRMRSDKSNKAIADQLQVDDKTVASVRADLEGRSEIPNADTRTDTLGRQQPASKPERPTPAEPEEPIEAEHPGDALAAHVAQRRGMPAAARAVQIEELAKAGKDSKTIGTEIGIAPDRVRRLARENAIPIPADQRKGIDQESVRIMEKTVDTLDVLTMDLPQINFNRLPKEEIPHWSSTMKAALKEIGKVDRELAARAKGSK